MTWPLSQDYNEAIQSPELCFNDPELKQGEARANAIGLPMPCSGNFADVYELNCAASGRKWAIKCFTRQVPGLRERYAAISAHLKRVNLPFMVDFLYLDQGIQVKGEWYPILKMHWVEGVTLNEFVKRYADQPQYLEKMLSQIWVRLARRLRAAKMAHADLQHGNVLLVPGNQAKSLAVRLIDYDGMFVPALAEQQSGELGHANYQHPQRLREGTYSAEVDRFPNLVIYTALRALVTGGRYLWNNFDNGDNLLFKQTDLDAPAQSPLFQDLLASSDPELRRLVQALAAAAQQPLHETPLLDELAGGLPSEAVNKSGPMPHLPPPIPETPAEAIKGAGPIPASPAAEQRPGRPATRSKVWVAAGGALALVILLAGGILFALQRRSNDGGPTQGNPHVVIAAPQDQGGSPEEVPAVSPDPKPQRSAVAGGAGGEAFQDLPPQPGLLVGFMYTTMRNKKYAWIRSLQPIYLTATDTRLGTRHGIPNGPEIRFQARKGYAVAGLVLQTAGRVQAFKVIFMRIKGRTLDPTDAQESVWHGVVGVGTETTIAGDGKPVIGIVGRSGADLFALGLIQVDQLAQPLTFR